ncbi:MAG TPA: PAS domain S-box protein [Candidatus Polarisedimenticolaceae bacterium]
MPEGSAPRSNVELSGSPGPNESRLAAILESAMDAIVSVDEAQRIVLFNRAAEQMFGCSAAEAVGSPLARFLPERFRSRHEGWVRSFGATGSTARRMGALGEVRALRADGTEVEVEASISQADTTGGKVYTVVLRDITERKAFEAELRTRDEALRRAQRIGRVGTWEMDAGGSLDWSEETFRIFGREAASAPPNFEQFLADVHGDDRDTVRAFVEGLAANPGERQVEYRVTARDGEIRVVLQRSGVLLGPDGGPTRVVGTIQDITELRELEQRLLHAQKMDSIGRLAGGIAHDFNNLLTAILGYTEMLEAQLSGDARLVEFVRQVRAAGERAAELTSHLLAFARKQIVQPRVVDLNGLLRDVERLLRRLLGETVELHSSLAPELGAVRIDPGRFEQVLVNLAVNARDAMPAGGTLTLETLDVHLDEEYARQHPGVVAGRYVLLAVSDTGVGMDAKTQARVFEPFFTTKQAGKGTGLGLSMVYGIVRQAGGHIWLYSEIGRGTTFKIYLPQVDVAAESTVAARPIPPSAGGDETILLVEDEPVVRRMAADSLAALGYRVLVAADGAEATAIADRHPDAIDLLLTDVILPKRSGPAIAEHVQARHPRCRVLFVSGYTANAIVHRGILDEGVRFLAKPFTPGALGRRVREVLDAP